MTRLHVLTILTLVPVLVFSAVLCVALGYEDVAAAAVRRWMMAMTLASLALLAVAGALATVVGRRIRALEDAAAASREHAAERRRTEEERTRLLARAEAARGEAEVANRTKDEFLATVSHELRTPLTAVLGWARMVRSGRLDADAIARGLEVIDRNARLQAQLIDDLLDVSRIITGNLRLDIRSIELLPVVGAALDAVRGAAETKGITIETDLADDLRAVRGDPDRLQQVVWNLLANAIKFSPEGGRVRIEARTAGDHAVIAVTDWGKGIEPEFLPFVFDRFRQADSVRNNGGLGLGLALVRHLSELHGGSVDVESDGVGRGARFTVTLPFAVARDGTSTQPVRPAPRFPTLAGVRVLVVDDDDDARQLLGIILEQCNAEVLTAASAEEALRAVEVEKPHVIVSDINMPGVDGYAFVRTLRDGMRDNVPAVALTAAARGEDRRRALAAGFDVHIAKPVEPSALAQVVGELAAAARRSGVSTSRV